MGVSIVMGVPKKRWIVYKGKSPSKNWMMTGGTPTLGKPLYLAGGLKNISQLGWLYMIIPNIWGKKKCSKPPTRYDFIWLYHGHPHGLAIIHFGYDAACWLNQPDLTNMTSSVEKIVPKLWKNQDMFQSTNQFMIAQLVLKCIEQVTFGFRYRWYIEVLGLNIIKHTLR